MVTFVYSTMQNNQSTVKCKWSHEKLHIICTGTAKQFAGITNCQSTYFRKLAFHFNASLTATNLARAA